MSNPYEDRATAAAYARLDMGDTYHLAYRDLPELLSRYAASGLALDFGCGTGRSTRLLKSTGLAAIGVDISDAMVREARTLDPSGDYRLIERASLVGFEDQTFDVCLAVMPFKSMSSREERIDTAKEIWRTLKPRGHAFVVATAVDVYTREYVSFSSARFPENRTAREGDVVKVVIKDLGDDRIVEDFLWSEASHASVFAQAGFEILRTEHPIPSPEDGHRCEWISETSHSPWLIFVLNKSTRRS